MTSVGIIDICSKLELKTPIKNPNNAKVNEIEDPERCSCRADVISFPGQDLFLLV